MKRSGDSDEVLVARCNSADPKLAAAAFNSLYRRHRDYVLRVALRFTADPELAADALQEAFTHLLKQFPPPGPGLELSAKLTTYLYPIVKNITLTMLRQARRSPPSSVEPDALQAPENAAAVRDDLDRLLANLADERREILTLRFVDEMALDEIAQVLEIPLGTVKSRLHNAIKALREDPAAKKFFET